jgi:hypothetical protein
MGADPEQARVCRCERPLLDAETCLRCGRPPNLLPVLSHPPARRRATWTRPGVVRAISTFAFFHGRAPVPADWNKQMADWPTLETVEALFGSLEEAARAAGIEPASPPRNRSKEPHDVA